MRIWLPVLLAALSAVSCQPALKIAGKRVSNPLERILATYSADFDSILSRPDIYEVQIIYTRIDRDKQQRPHFTSYHWNADSTRYFYPASTVKMPLALLALERINQLKRAGYPLLSRNTYYAMDSVRMYQQHYYEDAGAPFQKPGIAHDIRQVFVVSDNLAYNHLFDFLGRERINTALRAKGYTRTGIVHRFNYPGRDNRYASPITFYDSKPLLQQAEQFDSTTWRNPQHHLQKGVGYRDARDSLVRAPFDFGSKNWFALTDMEKMLRAVLFPGAVPAQHRFDLTENDYAFLLHYMGIFPRECAFPRYDTAAYWDGYVKFFLFGDSRARQDGSVRVFNKVGEAYGTLTDVAYVVDFQNNVEFVLAATILCNVDGIFNDDRYDYDTVGFPFLAKLGRAVLEHEQKRRRKISPDLSRFRQALLVGQD
ncbi:MAG: serine hydrolase [Saprospirales bacterium]|nr:serine hydrolase [Saprospirales bacterium]